MPSFTQREPPTAGRRTRLAWYAYDLGNTTVEFAVPLYLTIWIVQDLGVAAWVFGLASAISSFAIGLTGPYLGVRADERRERRRWFVSSASVATLLLALIAFLPRSGTGAAILILAIVMAANYFFQLSSLIYNASMLTAARGTNVVSLSATGIGLSYVGGLLGIALIDSLVSGRLLPGVSGRAYAVLPAALIFIVFSLPSFTARGLWQRPTDVVEKPEGRLHRRMYDLWKEAAREHRAGWFLAGFFALNSSIMGLTLYLPLHVAAVTNLEGTSLTIIFGIVVAVSIIGAAVVTMLHPVGDTVWRIIVVGLTLLGINALVLSLMRTAPQLVACGCVHGILSGALIPTVRAAFAQTFRSDYQALAFGLYGAVQRVSQGLGAALSPLASAAAGGRTATSVGIAAMGLMALIGVPLFFRWRLPGAGQASSTENP
jgi:MFS-type transporter involved in bile tolerance (Atg22 family)